MVGDVEVLDEELGAGDEGEPCLSKPLFFPGLDASQAAEHDAEVIAAFPAWFQLTYESGHDKQNDRVLSGWYNNKVQYKAQCGDERELRGVECDEYPFYSTVEGGPAAYEITPLVLKEISAKDNNVEGAALRVMQDDPDCHMATIAGPSGKGSRPRLFQGSKNQQYIVVPLVLPISSHICTNATAPPSGGGTGGGGPMPS